MKWSKYSTHNKEAEGTRYITMLSGKDSPQVTVRGNHRNILITPKTLSLTSIAYIRWPMERPRTYKRQTTTGKETHSLFTHYYHVHSYFPSYDHRTHRCRDYRGSHHEPPKHPNSTSVSTTNDPPSYVPSHNRHTLFTHGHRDPH